MLLQNQFLMTWIDAKGYCRLSNYTLISLETEAEDVLIHQHISNTEGISIYKTVLNIHVACIYYEK